MTGKKAAIIGFGNIAPMHVKSLATIGVQLTAVCDVREKNLQGAPRLFTDFREMLAAGEAGLFDVLHICLPHHLHAPVAIAALERGIHVLCEKPLATTVADATSMINAAEKSGARLGVVFQNRFSPGAVLIRETLQSGSLGAVRGGALRVTWYRDAEYYTASDWRGKIATEGGGVLINQSIHTFDLMNYFLEKVNVSAPHSPDSLPFFVPTEPIPVAATIANRTHPQIEVEDIAEGIIHYGEVPVSFFVNTYHPYDAPATIEILCENGRVQLIGEEAEITFADGTKKTAGPDDELRQRFGMKSYWGVSHIKLIQAFYAALETGEKFTPDGAEGLRTQRLINGIYDIGTYGLDTRPNGFFG